MAEQRISTGYLITLEVAKLKEVEALATAIKSVIESVNAAKNNEGITIPFKVTGDVDKIAQLQNLTKATGDVKVNLGAGKGTTGNVKIDPTTLTKVFNDFLAKLSQLLRTRPAGADKPEGVEGGLVRRLSLETRYKRYKREATTELVRDILLRRIRQERENLGSIENRGKNVKALERELDAREKAVRSRKALPDETIRRAYRVLQQEGSREDYEVLLRLHREGRQRRVSNAEASEFLRGSPRYERFIERALGFGGLGDVEAGFRRAKTKPPTAKAADSATTTKAAGDLGGTVENINAVAASLEKATSPLRELASINWVQIASTMQHMAAVAERFALGNKAPVIGAKGAAAVAASEDAELARHEQSAATATNEAERRAAAARLTTYANRIRRETNRQVEGLLLGEGLIDPTNASSQQAVQELRRKNQLAQKAEEAAKRVYADVDPGTSRELARRGLVPVPFGGTVKDEQRFQEIVVQGAETRANRLLGALGAPKETTAHGTPLPGGTLEGLPNAQLAALLSTIQSQRAAPEPILRVESDEQLSSLFRAIETRKRATPENLRIGTPVSPTTRRAPGLPKQATAFEVFTYEDVRSTRTAELTTELDRVTAQEAALQKRFEVARTNRFDARRKRPTDLITQQEIDALQQERAALAKLRPELKALRTRRAELQQELVSSQIPESRAGGYAVDYIGRDERGRFVRRTRYVAPTTSAEASETPLTARETLERSRRYQEAFDRLVKAGYVPRLEPNITDQGVVNISRERAPDAALIAAALQDSGRPTKDPNETESEYRQRLLTALRSGGVRTAVEGILRGTKYLRTEGGRFIPRDRTTPRDAADVSSVAYVPDPAEEALRGELDQRVEELRQLNSERDVLKSTKGAPGKRRRLKQLDERRGTIQTEISEIESKIDAAQRATVSRTVGIQPVGGTPTAPRLYLDLVSADIQQALDLFDKAEQQFKRGGAEDARGQQARSLLAKFRSGEALSPEDVAAVAGGQFGDPNNAALVQEQLQKLERLATARKPRTQRRAAGLLATLIKIQKTLGPAGTAQYAPGLESATLPDFDIPGYASPREAYDAIERIRNYGIIQRLGFGGAAEQLARLGQDVGAAEQKSRRRIVKQFLPGIKTASRSLAGADPRGIITNLFKTDEIFPYLFGTPRSDQDFTEVVPRLREFVEQTQSGKLAVRGARDIPERPLDSLDVAETLDLLSHVTNAVRRLDKGYATYYPGAPTFKQFDEAIKYVRSAGRQSLAERLKGQTIDDRPAHEFFEELLSGIDLTGERKRRTPAGARERELTKAISTKIKRANLEAERLEKLQELEAKAKDPARKAELATAIQEQQAIKDQLFKETETDLVPLREERNRLRRERFAADRKAGLTTQRDRALAILQGRKDLLRAPSSLVRSGLIQIPSPLARALDSAIRRAELNLQADALETTGRSEEAGQIRRQQLPGFEGVALDELRRRRRELTRTGDDVFFVSGRQTHGRFLSYVQEQILQPFITGDRDAFLRKSGNWFDDLFRTPGAGLDSALTSLDAEGNLLPLIKLFRQQVGRIAQAAGLRNFNPRQIASFLGGEFGEAVGGAGVPPGTPPEAPPGPPGPPPSGDDPFANLRRVSEELAGVFSTLVRESTDLVVQFAKLKTQTPRPAGGGGRVGSINTAGLRLAPDGQLLRELTNKQLDAAIRGTRSKISRIQSSIENPQFLSFGQIPDQSALQKDLRKDLREQQAQERTLLLERGRRRADKAKRDLIKAELGGDRYTIERAQLKYDQEVAKNRRLKQGATEYETRAYGRLDAAARRQLTAAQQAEYDADRDAALRANAKLDEQQLRKERGEAIGLNRQFDDQVTRERKKRDLTNAIRFAEVSKKTPFASTPIGAGPGEDPLLEEGRYARSVALTDLTELLSKVRRSQVGYRRIGELHDKLSVRERTTRDPAASRRIKDQLADAVLGQEALNINAISYLQEFQEKLKNPDFRANVEGFLGASNIERFLSLEKGPLGAGRRGPPTVRRVVAGQQLIGTLEGLQKAAEGPAGPEQDKATERLKRYGLTAQTVDAALGRLREQHQRNTDSVLRSTGIYTQATKTLATQETALDRVYRAARNVVTYATFGQGFFLITQNIIQAIRQSVEFERSLARVQGILRSQSFSERDDIRKRVLGLASQYGVQPLDLLQNVQVFAQAGFEGERAIQAAEASVRGQIGLGITAEQAQELLITVNALTQGAIGFENILDRISRVESTRAVSAQDLSIALQRVGAVAQQFFGAGLGEQVQTANPITGRLERGALQVSSFGGIDFADLVFGLTTQIVEQTRYTGTQAATSLRFILSRLAAPEIGGKLQEQFGIKLAANPEGTVLRPLVDILQDISNTYRALRGTGRTVEAAQLLQTVAGARQITPATAVFSDFDNVLKIARESASAFGDTARRTALVMETLGQQMDRLKVGFVEFGSSVLSDTGLAGTLATLANLFSTFLAPFLRGPVGLATAGLSIIGLTRYSKDAITKLLPKHAEGLIAAGTGIGGTLIRGAGVGLVGTTLTSLYRSRRRDLELRGFATDPGNVLGSFFIRSKEATGFRSSGLSPAEFQGTEFYQQFAELSKRIAPGLSPGEVATRVSEAVQRVQFTGDFVEGRRELVRELENVLPGLKGIQDESERTQLALDAFNSALTYYSAQSVDAAERLGALGKEYITRAQEELKKQSVTQVPTSFLGRKGQFLVESLFLDTLFGIGSPLAYRIKGNEFPGEITARLDKVFPGLDKVLANIRSVTGNSALEDVFNAKGQTLGQALDQLARQFRLDPVQEESLRRFREDAERSLLSAGRLYGLTNQERGAAIDQETRARIERDRPELLGAFDSREAVLESITATLAQVFNIDRRTGEQQAGKFVGGDVFRTTLLELIGQAMDELTGRAAQGSPEARRLQEARDRLSALPREAFDAAAVQTRARRAIRDQVLDTVVRGGTELQTIRAFSAFSSRLGLPDTRAEDELAIARQQVRSIVQLPFRLTADRVALLNQISKPGQYQEITQEVLEREGPTRVSREAGQNLLQLSPEQQERIRTEAEELRRQLVLIRDDADLFTGLPEPLQRLLVTLSDMDSAGLAFAAASTDIAKKLSAIKDGALERADKSLAELQDKLEVRALRDAAAQTIETQQQLVQESLQAQLSVRERLAEFSGPRAQAFARRLNVVDQSRLERLAAFSGAEAQRLRTSEFAAPQEQDAQRKAIALRLDTDLKRIDAQEQLRLNEVELSRAAAVLTESFQLVDGSIRQATSGLEQALVDPLATITAAREGGVGGVLSLIGEPIGRSLRQANFEALSRSLFGQEGIFRKQAEAAFGLTEEGRRRQAELDLQAALEERIKSAHNTGLKPLTDSFISAADALVSRLEAVSREKVASAEAKSEQITTAATVPPEKVTLPTTPVDLPLTPLGGKAVTKEAIQNRIRGLSLQYGIDPIAAEALLTTESSLNPIAFPLDEKTGRPAGGGAGAFGLGQFRLPTAMGLLRQGRGGLFTGDPQQLFDAETNLRLFFEQFSDDLEATGGDYRAAVLRYKKGPRYQDPTAPGLPNELLLELFDKEYQRLKNPLRQAAVGGIRGGGGGYYLPGFIADAQLRAIEKTKAQQALGQYHDLGLLSFDPLGREPAVPRTPAPPPPALGRPVQQLADLVTTAEPFAGKPQYLDDIVTIAKPFGFDRSAFAADATATTSQPQRATDEALRILRAGQVQLKARDITARIPRQEKEVAIDALNLGSAPRVPPLRYLAPIFGASLVPGVFGTALPQVLTSTDEAEDLATFRDSLARIDEAVGPGVFGRLAELPTDLERMQTQTTGIFDPALERATKEQLARQNLLAQQLASIRNSIGFFAGSTLGTGIANNREGAFLSGIGSQAGVAAGQQLGTVAGTAVGNIAFPVVGGIVGGLIGGAIGSLFGGDEPEPAAVALERIERNTREAATLLNRQNELLQYNNQLVGVPSTFQVPAYLPNPGGSGGTNTVVQQTVEAPVQINIYDARDPDAVAKAVARELRNTNKRLGNSIQRRP